jgi:hypothetical protein
MLEGKSSGVESGEINAIPEIQELVSLPDLKWRN